MMNIAIVLPRDICGVIALHHGQCYHDRLDPAGTRRSICIPYVLDSGFDFDFGIFDSIWEDYCGDPYCACRPCQTPFHTPANASPCPRLDTGGVSLGLICLQILQTASLSSYSSNPAKCLKVWKPDQVRRLCIGSCLTYAL